MQTEPIIYVPGDLADGMGAIHLQELAQRAASLSRQPVTLLTYGDSEFHANRRFRAEHLPLMATDNKIEETVRRLQIIKSANKRDRDSMIDSLVAMLREPEQLACDHDWGGAPSLGAECLSCGTQCEEPINADGTPIEAAAA